MLKQKHSEQNLELVSEMPNYNKWVFTNISPYLGERILEIGCGIGNITQLIKHKNLLVGIDVNARHLSQLKKKILTDENLILLKKDITEPKDIKALRSFHFDTILCLNVLEHIKDDQKCLQQLNSLLEDNGRIVLLCPNYPRLFGTTDESDGHYRRYSKKSLVNKVINAGFVVNVVYCMNILGVFGWLLHGRVLKVKTHVRSHFRILNLAAPLLMRLENIFKPPIGLSLIVIGTKKSKVCSNIHGGIRS